ncbi:T9SS type A sorting domain-containing protein [Fulvivirga maritima]|uniref:T9SS type A sorting domain-containing protein n=1 Tax=Fulvivirga maritima TaxID=2904247 RepID=UPI001F1D1552|nr:T9SS type A sorting domain-containing protein [Fulvivirga maritima]UII27134.1 T9SS type A sorting domain-containing protein [Fulvivirga maritima]
MAEDIDGVIEPRENGLTLEFSDYNLVKVEVIPSEFRYLRGSMSVNSKLFDVYKGGENEIYLKTGSYSTTFYNEYNKSAPRIIYGSLEVEEEDVYYPIELHKTKFVLITEQDSVLSNANINIDCPHPVSPVSVKTDENGEVEVFLPDGEYNYVISSPTLGVDIEHTFTIEGADHLEEPDLYMLDFSVKPDHLGQLANAEIEVGNKHITTDNKGMASLFFPTGNYSYKLSHPDIGVSSIQGTSEIVENSITENIELYTTSFQVMVGQEALSDVKIAIADKIITTNEQGIAQVYLPSGVYEAEITHPLLNDSISRTVEIEFEGQDFEIELSDVHFMVAETDGTPVGNTSITIDGVVHEVDAEGELNLYLERAPHSYLVMGDDILGAYEQELLTTEDAYNEIVTVYKATFNLTDGNENPIINTAIQLGDSALVTSALGKAIFFAFPGNYAYLIEGMQLEGEVVIEDEDVETNINQGYEVKFIAAIDNALALNEVWPQARMSITVDGSTLYSDASPISFYLPSGTYNYTVHLDERPGQMEGQFTIDDEGIVEPINLRLMTIQFEYGEEIFPGGIVSFEGDSGVELEKGASMALQIIGIFPGKYSAVLTSPELIGEYPFTLEVPEYVQGNPAQVLYKEINLPDLTVYFNVVDSDNEGVSDINIEVGQRSLTTDPSGFAFIKAFAGSYSYELSYENHVGVISNELILTDEGVSEDIKVLMATFKSNAVNIFLEGQFYTGTHHFLLEDGTYPYELSFSQPIESGVISKDHKLVEKNIYMSTLELVDGVTQAPIDKFNVQFFWGDFEVENSATFGVLTVDNGFDNIFSVQADGYMDTTVHLQLENESVIRVAMRPKTHFEITFLGADKTVISNQIIAIGDAVNVPEPPIVQGYIFVGWFTQEGDQVSDFTNLNEDLIVTAKYEHITAVDSPLTSVLQIYPNPVENQLYITLEEGIEPIGNTIIIYDLRGQKLGEYVLNNGVNTLDVSHLECGVYLFQLGNTYERVIKK